MLPAAQLYAVSFPQQEWLVGVFPFVGAILFGLSVASCRGRPSSGQGVAGGCEQGLGSNRALPLPGSP